MRSPISTLMSHLSNVFKLRIGVTIAFTAVAGSVITPGPALSAWQVAVLALAVLMSSASAGGFNQYVERDLDARMQRTKARPFVTGALSSGRYWLWVLYAMLFVAVVSAGWALNPMVGLYVFLGAFFYAVVYTVWLKRRTPMNIVIGGLAGSFAVLAGAAAVDPDLSPLPMIFAAVLFLWTPSHFWSLAIALHKDYASAGVPMLPVVLGDRATAWVILGNTILLVAVSLLPAFYGMGWIYLAGAIGGGAYFLARNIQLIANPCERIGMASFRASLVQLSLLLVGAMLDAQF